MGVDPDPSFAGVSCPTSDFCMAVGKAVPASYPVQGMPLVQVYDGSAWTTLEAPRYPDPGDLYGGVALTDVSCWAVDGCMVAVEFEYDDDLIYLAYTWDGADWTQTDYLSTPPAENPKVDCVAGGECFLIDLDSVGFNYYDGSDWTLLYPDNYPYFTDMSCGAVDNCVAVDEDGALYQYDGEGFTDVVVPGCEGGDCEFSFDCTASPHCLLTAQSGSHLVVMVWNGTDWASVALPENAAGFDRVACAGRYACLVLGERHTGTGTEAISWAFPGSNWYAKPAPPHGVDAYSDLACAHELCIGVGRGPASEGGQLVASAFAWENEEPAAAAE